MDLDRPRILPVQKMDVHAVLPTRAHPGDAGLDLYSLQSGELAPGEGKVIRTGIALEIAEGFVGLVADRSSMAKRGLKTAGGIIDAGYRGEIHIVLWNISPQPQKFEGGERIAQLLMVKIATPTVEEVKVLNTSERGAKGFGSSGR